MEINEESECERARYVGIPMILNTLMYITLVILFLESFHHVIILKCFSQVVMENRHVIILSPYSFIDNLKKKKNQKTPKSNHQIRIKIPRQQSFFIFLFRFQSQSLKFLLAHSFHLGPSRNSTLNLLFLRLRRPPTINLPQ